MAEADHYSQDKVRRRLRRLRSQDAVAKSQSLIIILVLGNLHSTTCSAGEAGTAKHHIDQGNRLLAAGSLSDALAHYNQAVDAEPDNYQGRYRRATCLLALGRARTAMPDLDRVIELRPDFWRAKQERAGVYLKQGKFDKAQKDFEACQVQSEEAREQLRNLKTIKQHFENAKVYASRGYYDRALKSLDRIKETTPWFGEMRELRADCYEMYGEIQNAINELKPVIQISPSKAPETYQRLAKLYYLLPEVDQALDYIRECLKIDPDHKVCFAFYKVAKKLNKQLKMSKTMLTEENYDGALGKIDAAFGTTENHAALLTEPSPKLHSQLHFSKCRVFEKMNDYKRAVAACTDAFENDKSNVEPLFRRSEIHKNNEDLQKSLQDLKTIRQHDPHYPGIDEKIEKGEKLLKRSKSRDYYKILGVKRNASTKEIKKSYKKLAIQYHPDRCGQDKTVTEGWTPEKCEQKFRDIADAKEVLTDGEKRQQFDDGSDPLDAQEQADANRGHGHPFGGGGFRFRQGGGGPFGGGGGGGGFKFKFNF